MNLLNNLIFTSSIYRCVYYVVRISVTKGFKFMNENVSSVILDTLIFPQFINSFTNIQPGLKADVLKDD